MLPFLSQTTTSPRVALKSHHSMALPGMRNAIGSSLLSRSLVLCRTSAAHYSQEVRPLSGLGNQAVTVWWDASCPLCTKEISLFKRLDVENRIRFHALSQSTPDRVNVNGCPVTKKQLLARFHAQEGSDGALLSGAAAFAAMWRVVPHRGLRWLGECARRPAFLWVLERTYRGFLVIRPSMQRFAKLVTKQ